MNWLLSCPFGNQSDTILQYSNHITQGWPLFLVFRSISVHPSDQLTRTSAWIGSAEELTGGCAVHPGQQQVLVIPQATTTTHPHSSSMPPPNNLLFVGHPHYSTITHTMGDGCSGVNHIITQFRPPERTPFTHNEFAHAKDYKHSRTTRMMMVMTMTPAYLPPAHRSSRAGLMTLWWMTGWMVAHEWMNEWVLPRFWIWFLPSTITL